MHSPKLTTCILRGFALQVLQHHSDFQWTHEPGGFMRTCLAPDMVMNVFDASLVHEGATLIHTHPLDFTSMILAGELRHFRHTRYGRAAAPAGAQPYGYQDFDVEFKGASPAKGCFLVEEPMEVYHAGDTYQVLSHEIHRVGTEDGTITVLTREYITKPTGSTTFWPYVAPGALSAKPPEPPKFDNVGPGPADPKVVAEVAMRANERWFCHTR